MAVAKGLGERYRQPLRISGSRQATTVRTVPSVVSSVVPEISIVPSLDDTAAVAGTKSPELLAFEEKLSRPCPKTLLG